jgi:flagellar basal-body rod modification protein FlgD
MAAAAGIFHPQAIAGQPQLGTAPVPQAGTSSGTSGTSGSSASSSASSDSATITANDFLTLLVTEMQNQDPTADTDPNEYINQLVQVNSLEQLININQTLSTSLGTPTSTSSATGAQADAASGSPGPAAATGPNASTAPQSVLKASAAPAEPAAHANGNLSTPAADPAAQHVAHALEHRSASRPIAGRLSTFERTALNKMP